MSGTATIAITVGVAVAVLVGFFIVYYLGNVANSIYDVKVGVRKDFEKKVKELQDWVDKDTKQRINWMRDENKEEGKRFKESVEGHLEETFGEMQKNVERLRADVASLQVQVQGLQEGKFMRGAKLNEAPEMVRPKMGKNQTPTGMGDLEVPKTGVPDSNEAPDMAVPKGTPAPVGGGAKEGDVPTKKPIQSRPTPPPPPASASMQPAGRASVEKKAEKKKKKRDPDEFESFNNFSNTFKPGS